PQIEDWVAVEQRGEAHGEDNRIVLVIVLRKGQVFERGLAERIRKEILERCSPAHVPAVVIPVSELPVTHNGKRSDRAVSDAVNRDPIGNLEAIRNPSCLAELANFPLPTSAAAEHQGAPGPAECGSEVVGKVISIWEEILHTSVNPDDDFFEIGGDSLRGLRVLNAVEREFGTRLPMSSLLFSGSKPSGMAEMLDAIVSGGRLSVVVPLRPGEGGVPVFWVPGGGMMSAVAFREVSQRLGQRPVFGLEASLNGDPASSLPELAKEFVEAVLATTPDGPYFLFGFSAGSFVAYEMAAQLREHGRPVDLLVLFDAHLVVQHSVGNNAVVIRQRATYHARRMARLPLRSWPPYLAGTGLVIRKRLYQRLFPKRAGSWRHEVGESAGSESVFDRLDRHNRRLVAKYRLGNLPHLDTRTAVIIAERSSWSGVDPELDPRFAWRRLVAGEVEFLRVPGSHLSMIEGSEVEGLGNALRDLLERTEDSLKIPSPGG
ncbi:MAG: hypothetical protein IH614_17675, partial [Desulfuromonadales bacterium]|nr:hypothetical protein [Desulfuromonadales bacterium]